MLDLRQRGQKSEHYSNRAILQEKDKFFGEPLGASNFICSNGCLSRFKKQQGILCKWICGDASVVDPDIVNSFFAEKWSTLKKEFLAQYIFNAYEIGLYFKAHPSHILAMKKEKCSWGK